MITVNKDKICFPHLHEDGPVSIIYITKLSLAIATTTIANHATTTASAIASSITTSYYDCSSSCDCYGC